jgi:hypothetical protein
VLARRRQDRIVESHFQDSGGEPRGTETFVRPADEVVVEPAGRPAVTPVPGQDGPHPRVRPDLGNPGPYRT